MFSKSSSNVYISVILFCFIMSMVRASLASSFSSSASSVAARYCSRVMPCIFMLSSMNKPRISLFSSSSGRPCLRMLTISDIWMTVVVTSSFAWDMSVIIFLACSFICFSFWFSGFLGL